MVKICILCQLLCGVFLLIYFLLLYYIFVLTRSFFTFSIINGYYDMERRGIEMTSSPNTLVRNSTVHIVPENTPTSATGIQFTGQSSNNLTVLNCTVSFFIVITVLFTFILLLQLFHPLLLTTNEAIIVLF